MTLLVDSFLFKCLLTRRQIMTTVNLAFYEKKDWEYFLSIVDDRESLHDTWEDWFKSFVAGKMNLIAQGFYVNEILIDVRELIEYCYTHNLKNNSAARAQFVATK